MSVIASLGVKEEVKNILDSGGFLRDVQQHLQAKFPQIRGISRRSVRRYCQTNGLRRFSAKKLSKSEQENAVKKASKEVYFSSLFLSPYLLVTVLIFIFRFLISDFWFLISDFWFLISDFRFPIWDFWFLIWDLGFGIWDFLFLIAVFRFPLSDFGFRTSDFWFLISYFLSPDSWFLFSTIRKYLPSISEFWFMKFRKRIGRKASWLGKSRINATEQKPRKWWITSRVL